MGEFRLVTACDNISISAERFRADLDIERVGNANGSTLTVWTLWWILAMETVGVAKKSVCGAYPTHWDEKTEA